MSDLPESAVEAGAQALAERDDKVLPRFRHVTDAKAVLRAASTEITCPDAHKSWHDPERKFHESCDLCGDSGTLWVLRARDTKEGEAG